jgi:hypothetical protein
MSKKPIAYYPLDGDLLNHADESRLTATSSYTVFDGSENSTHRIFFRGQPMVKGLRNACHLRGSYSGNLRIPNPGLATTPGKQREFTIEFYHMFNSYDYRTNATGILRLSTGTGDIDLGMEDGTYYLHIGNTDYNGGLVSVQSGQINRPKQIVIRLTSDSITLIVDGVQSDKIDTEDITWASSTADIELRGIGTSTSSFSGFAQFNAFSIFPYALAPEEIDELREAAWQADQAYSVVNAYGGNYISCFGGNIDKNGTLTLNKNSEWRNATLSNVSSVTDGEIGYSNFKMPTYVNPTSALPTTINSRIVIPTSASQYVDHVTPGGVVGMTAICARFPAKGTGQYASKEYLFTASSGTKFIGIYSNTDNLYYEYIDDSNEESLTGTITTGLGAYATSGLITVGLDGQTNELIFSTNTSKYSTLYGGSTKVAVEGLKPFLSGGSFRFGGDVRTGDQTNPHVGHLYSILMGFGDDPDAELSFVYGKPQSNGVPLGFFASGKSTFYYEAPAEFLGYWDGTTTEPGVLNLYMDGDVSLPGSIEIGKATDINSTWTYTSGMQDGPSNIREFRQTEIDDTGKIYRVKVQYGLTKAPHVTGKIDKIELNSYKVTSGHAVINDGRSEYNLSAGRYFTIAPDNKQAHARGPYDGYRPTWGPGGTGITPIISGVTNPSAISCMLWVDSNPAIENINTGDYTTKVLMSLYYSNGFTLSLTANATDRYHGVDIIPSGGSPRIYINGENIAYTGTAPNSGGKLKTNCWNHVTIIPTSGSLNEAGAIFLGRSAHNTSVYNEGICFNDIALFIDTPNLTTTNQKDAFASALAAPYFGPNGALSTYVSHSESSLSVQLGDGLTQEVKRQWRALS